MEIVETVWLIELTLRTMRRSEDCNFWKKGLSMVGDGVLSLDPLSSMWTRPLQYCTMDEESRSIMLNHFRIAEALHPVLALAIRRRFSTITLLCLKGSDFRALRICDLQKLPRARIEAGQRVSIWQQQPGHVPH